MIKLFGLFYYVEVGFIIFEIVLIELEIGF